MKMMRGATIAVVVALGALAGVGGYLAGHAGGAQLGPAILAGRLAWQPAGRPATAVAMRPGCARAPRRATCAASATSTAASARRRSHERAAPQDRRAGCGRTAHPRPRPRGLRARALGTHLAGARRGRSAAGALARVCARLSARLPRGTGAGRIPGTGRRGGGGGCPRRSARARERHQQSRRTRTRAAPAAPRPGLICRQARHSPDGGALYRHRPANVRAKKVDARPVPQPVGHLRPYQLACSPPRRPASPGRAPRRDHQPAFPPPENPVSPTGPRHPRVIGRAAPWALRSSSGRVTCVLGQPARPDIGSRLGPELLSGEYGHTRALRSINWRPSYLVERSLTLRPRLATG